jgi:hypothetical protein
VAKNPTPTRWLVAVGFGLVGVLTGVLVYALERGAAGTHVDKVLIFLVGLAFPTAVSAIYITEIATTWLIEKWANEEREIIYVETFKTAGEMAQKRLDVVKSMRNERLTQHVYCTSHCNLFYDVGVFGKSEKANVEEANAKFFRRLATLTVTSEPGLMLLLFYPSEPAFVGEMGPRLDIYLEVCEAANVALSLEQFSPRRLMQVSVKDYFVFEDHVFKTIRKTPHSEGQTEYMHIQSKKIAGLYRAWLADLFEHGDGFNNPTRFVEKDNFLRKYDDFKKSLARERAHTQVSSA